VRLSIPRGSTNRGVVPQVATASHIPVEALCEELNHPVFLRGQAIHGFAGDEFDQIADNYENMQWWLSDTGLNMAIVNSIGPIEEDTQSEQRSSRTCCRRGTWSAWVRRWQALSPMPRFRQAPS
jgi:hypothetical protein